MHLNLFSNLLFLLNFISIKFVCPNVQLNLLNNSSKRKRSVSLFCCSVLFGWMMFRCDLALIRIQNDDDFRNDGPPRCLAAHRVDSYSLDNYSMDSHAGAGRSRTHKYRRSSVIKPAKIRLPHTMQQEHHIEHSDFWLKRIAENDKKTKSFSLILALCLLTGGLQHTRAHTHLLMVNNFIINWLKFKR